MNALIRILVFAPLSLIESGNTKRSLVGGDEIEPSASSERVTRTVDGPVAPASLSLLSRDKKNLINQQDGKKKKDFKVMFLSVLSYASSSAGFGPHFSAFTSVQINTCLLYGSTVFLER